MLRLSRHPSSNLPDIVRQGFVPNDGTRGIWPDELPVVGFLFFCDEIEGARHYQEQMGTDEPSFILRFPRPKGSRRDPHGDMMGERMVATDVHVSSIDIEIGGTWTPLADLDLTSLLQ